MSYNHYHGNTGRVERVHTGEELPSPPPSPPAPPPYVPPPPPPPPPRSGTLEGLLGRLNPGALGREDWLVLGLLWLMYRLSGETEYLVAMGAYLFL